MVDLEGTLELTTADRARLAHPSVGGVVLFTRNYESPAQLAELTASLHRVRSPPLLVAVDQEGGRVQRFRDGFTRLPCAARLGSLYEHDSDGGCSAAHQAGLVMASELKAVGVDLSFAPVLDVGQVDSDVIGDRSFHHRPETVTALGRAFIDGMHKAGMSATGKHFPGHGGVSADSHQCLPHDNRTLDAVEDCDLKPYLALRDVLDAVMTAHVQFDAIDPDTPTYSSFWLRRMLRDTLGFTGIVFSDDLAMQGAVDRRPLAQRARRAQLAGCDIILICNDPAAADEILAASLEPPDQHRLAAMRGQTPQPVAEEVMLAARERMTDLA